MAAHGSIGRKATATALACVLGVSMAPGAAFAKTDSAADASAAAAAVVGKDGSTMKASIDSGAMKAASDDAKEADANDVTEGSEGVSEAKGESGADAGESEDAASGGKDGSGSEAGSESGESSEGSESGTDESGKDDGADSGNDSGDDSGKTDGGETGKSGNDDGDGSDESGTSGKGNEEKDAGQGQDGNEDSGEKAVLDLAATTTSITIEDIEVGKTPVVKVSLAGEAARDITDDDAFAISYFAPDGSKAISFGVAGRYSARVAAASTDAVTSGGEKVIGKSKLVFFQVKEATSTSSSASGADEEADGNSTSSSSSSGTTQTSSDSTNSADSSGSSSSSAGASSGSSTSSSSTTSSASSGSSSSQAATVYHYTASGSGGGVTYLAPVNLASPAATRAGVQTRTVGGVAVAVAAISTMGTSAAAVSTYCLDDAATDVSALVAQANGAALLFWGGGTEIAPNYIWSVDSASLTRDDAFGLDLKVSAAATDEDEVGAADATALQVGQAGALPNGLVLFWRTSSVFFDGESVDVYRRDAKSGAYELVEEGLQTADGYVSFAPPAGGEYVVVESGAKVGADAPLPKVTEILMPDEAYADEPAEASAAELADEGGSDGWVLPAALAAALASAGGVWLAMRRKMASAFSASAETAQPKE